MAAMTMTSATSALETAVMQPVKTSRAVPEASTAATARDRPVVQRKKAATRPRIPAETDRSRVDPGNSPGVRRRSWPTLAQRDDVAETRGG